MLVQIVGPRGARGEAPERVAAKGARRLVAAVRLPRGEFGRSETDDQRRHRKEQDRARDDEDTRVRRGWIVMMCLDVGDEQPRERGHGYVDQESYRHVVGLE